MNGPAQYISDWMIASPEERETLLRKLDDAGLFMLPGEDPEHFCRRISTLLNAVSEAEKGNLPAELQPHIANWQKIPDPIREEAETLLMTHYHCRNPWVPVYFSSQETGHFSAGVQLEIDETYPLIFLHGAFARKEHHLGCSRKETLAHELAHGTRMFFPLSRYEEYFACHTSGSRFRRMAGNLFRNPLLITLLLTGAIIGTALPILGIPTGGWALLLPLGIVSHEFYLHIRLAGVRKKLQKLGLKPFPVLLRLTDQEIGALHTMAPEEIEKLQEQSLRWKLFFQKFHA